jgi:deoxyribonuclease IV
MSGPRLGAHMSIAGGMPKAVERAVAVEATALQVFVKSSNQWAARPLAADEIATYRSEAKAAGVDRHTLAHASYLINLASPDPVLWEKSVAAFRVEFDRCDALGIPWLVVHPGSHVGSGTEAGLGRVGQALARALPREGSGGATGVLLEITAGQGNTLGSRFEELAEMMRLADRGDRLGVCFDTCHALAAGYEFRDAASYRHLMATIDRTVGAGRIRGFHLNDSKGDIGSHLDRHEHIGRGKIGLDAFGFILNDDRFRDVPMVLETEKGDDLAEDRVNLGVLRSLVRP